MSLRTEIEQRRSNILTHPKPEYRVGYVDALNMVLELLEGTDDAERTVHSLATMLGWMNVPPQHILEAEIRAMKARMAVIPDLLAGCKAALGAFEHNHAIDWDDLARAIAKAEGGDHADQGRESRPASSAIACPNCGCEYKTAQELRDWKDQTKVWILGRYIAETPDGAVWQFSGVFRDREAAVQACQTRSYFIGPAQLGEPLPHEGTPWPSAEYPLALKPETT